MLVAFYFILLSQKKNVQTVFTLIFFFNTEQTK